MPTIPPMVTMPKRESRVADASWPTFNLIFVLGLSSLLNILLLLRLATVANP
jgi:hypothetical protein